MKKKSAPRLEKEIIAIIPARGGSKGIPKKNIALLKGRPLLAYSVDAARNTIGIKRVLVSTDDAAIGDVARALGAEVVRRPENLSGDTATSESALFHSLDHLKRKEGYEPDLVVFLQATSPLRRPDDIGRAIETLEKENADSLFSACRLHGFLWRQTVSGVESFNYDYRDRQRRQDAPKDFIENGSIYIFKPWVLRQFQNRLGGKIAMFPMEAIHSFQVDEPEDLMLMEKLLAVPKRIHKENLSHVRLLALDFDGVMTDNRVVVDEKGYEAVLCHRGDGWGLAQLKRSGVDVIVISTEKNPTVAARCRKLGIFNKQGCDDKLATLKRVASDRGVKRDEIAYVGNDVNDLACLNWTGFPIAVRDASEEVKSAACWITRKPGGMGAVREVCDLILEQARVRHVISDT